MSVDLPRPYPTAAPAAPHHHAAPVDRDPYEAFAAWVMSQHTITWPPGGFPMCSCGNPARRCQVIAKAREVLGYPVPWEPASPFTTR